MVHSKQKQSVEKVDEFSARLEVTESKVDIGITSRFMSVLSRFFTNKIELWGVASERELMLAKARTEQEVNLITVAGGVLEQEFLNDPEKALKIIAGDQYLADDSTINKSSVVKYMLEDLRDRDLKGDEKNEGAIEDFDQDLLNYINGHAENASSDERQRMWGQVLSREVQKPGTFSIATINSLAGLDKASAKSFQTFAELRVDEYFIPWSLSGSQYCNTDLVVNDLVDLGLFSSPAAVNASQPVKNECSFVMFENNWLVLEVKPSIRTLTYPAIRLSKVGREIASIFPVKEIEAAEHFTEIVQQEIKNSVLFEVPRGKGSKKHLDDYKSVRLYPIPPL